MKYICSIICAMLICLAPFFSKAQDSAYVASIDSVNTGSVLWMKDSLGLSDTQVAVVTQAMQLANRQYDSLNNTALPPEQLSFKIMMIDRSFRLTLQMSLTPPQWLAYLQLEADRKNAFLQFAAENNIPVTE